MKKEMEQVNGENEAFMGRLIEYKVSLRNSKTKLDERHLKSLSLVREFKRGEQEWSILLVKIDLLHKSTLRSSIITPLNVTGNWTPCIE